MLQLLIIAAFAEKKTTFLDNFRSSRPEVIQNNYENCEENILGGVVLLLKSKRLYYHGCFPEENHFVEHFQFLIRYCFLAEWQLSISFLDAYMFSEYFFTSVRVTFGLLAFNVEKPLRWRLQTHLFSCLHWKNISLFGGGLLKQLSIQSVNKFSGHRNQNSLDTRFFSAIFH